MIISIVLQALTGTFETDMARASKTADKRMKEIKANATKLGKEIGIAFTVASTAIFYGIKKAIDNADHLNDLNQRLGLSAQLLSDYAYAATQTGTDIEGLSLGLKKLTKNIADAADSSSAAGHLFAALGIDAVDKTTGKLQTLEKLLPQIADRFKELDDPTLESALAIQLFGTSGTDLLEFLNQGAAGLEDFREKAKALGVELSDSDLKAADAFNDTLGDIKTLTQGLFTQIARDLLPQLQAVASEFSNAAQKGGAVSEVARDIADAFRSLGVIANFLRKTFQLYVDITQSLTDAFIGLGLGIHGVALAALGDVKGAAADFDAARDSFSNIGVDFQETMRNMRKEAELTSDAIGKFDLPGATVGRRTGANDPTRNRVINSNLADKLSGFLDDPTGSKAKAAAAEAKRLAAERLREEQARERAIRQFQDDIDSLSASMGGDFAKANTVYLKSLRDIKDEYERGGATANQYATQQGLLKDQFDKTIAEIKASVEGPLTEATNNFQEALRKLHEDAAAVGADESKVADNEKLLRREFQETTEAIKDRLDPFGALLQDMQFELDLIGKSNAERIVALELRKQELGMTDEQKAAYERENAAKIEAIKTTELQIEARDREVNALDEFRQNFQDSVTDVLTGAKSIGEAFKNLADSIIAQIARIIAQNLAASLFGAQGTSGGFFGSLFGLFTGSGTAGITPASIAPPTLFIPKPPGFEAGTDFAPGGLAIVGESGPELVNLPRGSRVTPNTAITKAIGARNIRQTFVVQGAPTRRTREQMARESGREARRALLRT